MLVEAEEELRALSTCGGGAVHVELDVLARLVGIVLLRLLPSLAVLPPEEREPWFPNATCWPAPRA